MSRAFAKYPIRVVQTPFGGTIDGKAISDTQLSADGDDGDGLWRIRERILLIPVCP